MRIALVVERFESVAGGVEHAVWNIARELAAEGDEVHVVARAIGGDAMAGIELHRLNVPRFWQPLRVASFSIASRRLLERRDFDLIHGFSRTLHQDVFHAGGGSHADSMQHTYGARGAALRRASPRHALLLSIERRIFSDPRQTIQCVSGMVRDEIAERFATPRERLRVIHYGVDCDRFAPETNRRFRADLRHELGAGDSLVWLFAGSGWRRKGLDTGLAALAKAGPRHQLWVAGRDLPAPWQSLARRLGVADRVRFLGVRHDLERVLAGADGLLFPTRYDAFGMVALEAAAAGRPVITSGRAGAAELLEGAGIVVRDAESSQDFADAITICEEAPQREQFGKAGIEIAQRHTWSDQVAKLRCLYRSLTR